MHIFMKVANQAALLLPKNTNSLAHAKLGEEICQRSSLLLKYHTSPGGFPSHVPGDGVPLHSQCGGVHRGAALPVLAVIKKPNYVLKKQSKYTLVYKV